MNNNLKVIQLIDSLAPGGAEMMAVNIANALEEDGIQSHICTTRKEGDLKFKIAKNVGYLFLDKKRIIDLQAIRKLNRYLKKHQITIVHAHSSSYFMGFLMKLLNPKRRLIWHDHFGLSESLHKRQTFPLVWISSFFDVVLVVNSLLFEWNKKYLKTDNIYFIQNFASFNNDKSAQTILKGENETRIVCLANLRPQKDHINLLKAFSLIHAKYKNWTLHLVGLNVLDEYANKIIRQINEQHLANHVFLYGTCSDIQHILSQATIGVLASNSEGLPVALLEYGLAKLPVVVTDVGECSKVVTNQESGFIVPKSDEVALSMAITKLIENKSVRVAFGTEFFKQIKTNYSKEAYIKQLIYIYTRG